MVYVYMSYMDYACCVFTFSYIIPATSIKNRSHKTDYDFDEHIINNIVVEYT